LSHPNGRAVGRGRNKIVLVADLYGVVCLVRRGCSTVNIRGAAYLVNVLGSNETTRAVGYCDEFCLVIYFLNAFSTDS
jgi:hypothetical protein